jgi:hypothetical protein
MDSSGLLSIAIEKAQPITLYDHWIVIIWRNHLAAFRHVRYFGLLLNVLSSLIPTAI